MVTIWRDLVALLLLLLYPSCVVSDNAEQLFKGPKPTSFVELGSRTSDELPSLGLGSNLDASLDRISSKLNNERMHRLLSINDDDSLFDGIPGLKNLMQEDDVTKEAVQAVKSVTPERPKEMRMQQVSSEAKSSSSVFESTQVKTALKALAVKEESLQQQIEEMKLELSHRNDDGSSRMEKLKADIVSEVTAKLARRKKIAEYSDQHGPERFRQRQTNENQMYGSMQNRQQSQNTQHIEQNEKLSTKRNVLRALQKTLEVLKQRHVLTREETATNPPRAEAEVVSPIHNIKNRVMQNAALTDGEGVDDYTDYEETFL